MPRRSKGSRKPSYSIILFDAKKKKLAGKPFAKASYYEIYYGKKKIVRKKLFNRNTKKAPIRRKYLSALIKKIEIARLKAIAKRARTLKALKKKKELQLLQRRKKAHKKRSLEKAKQVARKVVRKLPVTKVVQKPVSIKLEREIKILKNVYYEPSLTRPAAVFGKAKITPINVYTDEYEKRYINKKILTGYHYIADIEILDFSMKSLIEINHHNFEEVKIKLFDTIYPHIEKFFDESEGTLRRFILRLKYSYPVEGGDSMQEMGYGRDRRHMITKQQMLTEVLALIEGFGEKHSPTARDTYIRLSSNESFYISGFTIENILLERKSD